ncbi:uncharacterized protein LOC110892809 [Helianthus annuus]|uniref:uncharacterized protein LOC110892809 n=1 Tax=Helianthus annuus TaxID=4232 RepID=UPI000B8F2EE1|nr:uncharacterized protein LOC110892809 [Helianthus annuus]
MCKLEKKLDTLPVIHNRPQNPFFSYFFTVVPFHTASHHISAIKPPNPHRLSSSKHPRARNSTPNTTHHTFQLNIHWIIRNRDSTHEKLLFFLRIFDISGMASSSTSRRARLVLVRELIRSLQFRYLRRAVTSPIVDSEE